MTIPGEKIKSKSRELGFSFCGFAKASPLAEEENRYTDFIRQKKHATFGYLERFLPQRLDPGLILPESRTVIGLLLNYYPEGVIPEKDRFIVSKYAYGKNYKKVVKDKLNGLIRFMKEESGELKARAFVDSGPVMEKRWAQKCGLGWQGKNTLLINPSAGSFFFIGIILTDLELEPDRPETDHCGGCDLCVRACPTDALHESYCLDISLCISYHTIETRHPVPEDLFSHFRNRIFGCDICQDVCPYNRYAKSSGEPVFQINKFLKTATVQDWFGLTEDKFIETFADSPLLRTGYEKIMNTAFLLSPPE